MYIDEVDGKLETTTKQEEIILTNKPYWIKQPKDLLQSTHKAEHMFLNCSVIIWKRRLLLRLIKPASKCFTEEIHSVKGVFKEDRCLT